MQSHQEELVRHLASLLSIGQKAFNFGHVTFETSHRACDSGSPAENLEKR